MAFKKGQSGNPLGKKVGTRDKINRAFLRDLEEVWRTNGKAALEAAAAENPAAFCAIVAKLQPREADLNVRHSGTITHEHRELSATASLIADALGERAEGAPPESLH